MVPTANVVAGIETLRPVGLGASFFCVLLGWRERSCCALVRSIVAGCRAMRILSLGDGASIPLRSTFYMGEELC